MKIRAFIFGALLLACLTTIYAEPPKGEWCLYWLGRDSSRAYVSTGEGYSVRGTRVLVSTYLEYPRTGNYSLMGEIFDCVTAKYTLLSMTEYDKNDNIIKNFDNENPNRTFKPFNISDRQSVLFDGVCGDMVQGKPVSYAEMRKYFELRDLEFRIRDGQIKSNP